MVNLCRLFAKSIDAKRLNKAMGILENNKYTKLSEKYEKMTVQTKLGGCICGSAKRTMEEDCLEWLEYTENVLLEYDEMKPKKMFCELMVLLEYLNDSWGDATNELLLPKRSEIAMIHNKYLQLDDLFFDEIIVAYEQIIKRLELNQLKEIGMVGMASYLESILEDFVLIDQNCRLYFDRYFKDDVFSRHVEFMDRVFPFLLQTSKFIQSKHDRFFQSASKCKQVLSRVSTDVEDIFRMTGLKKTFLAPPKNKDRFIRHFKRYEKENDFSYVVETTLMIEQLFHGIFEDSQFPKTRNIIEAMEESKSHLQHIYNSFQSLFSRIANEKGEMKIALETAKSLSTVYEKAKTPRTPEVRPSKDPIEVPKESIISPKMYPINFEDISPTFEKYDGLPEHPRKSFPTPEQPSFRISEEIDLGRPDTSVHKVNLKGTDPPKKPSEGYFKINQTKEDVKQLKQPQQRPLKQPQQKPLKQPQQKPLKRMKESVPSSSQPAWNVENMTERNPSVQEKETKTNKRKYQALTKLDADLAALELLRTLETIDDTPMDSPQHDRVPRRYFPKDLVLDTHPRKKQSKLPDIYRNTNLDRRKKKKKKRVAETHNETITKPGILSERVAETHNETITKSSVDIRPVTVDIRPVTVDIRPVTVDTNPVTEKSSMSATITHKNLSDQNETMQDRPSTPDNESENTNGISISTIPTNPTENTSSFINTPTINEPTTQPRNSLYHIISLYSGLCLASSTLKIGQNTKHIAILDAQSLMLSCQWKFINQYIVNEESNHYLSHDQQKAILIPEKDVHSTWTVRDNLLVNGDFCLDVEHGSDEIGSIVTVSQMQNGFQPEDNHCWDLLDISE